MIDIKPDNRLEFDEFACKIVSWKEFLVEQFVGQFFCRFFLSVNFFVEIFWFQNWARNLNCLLSLLWTHQRKSKETEEGSQEWECVRVTEWEGGWVRVCYEYVSVCVWKWVSERKRGKCVLCVCVWEREREREREREIVYTCVSVCKWVWEGGVWERGREGSVKTLHSFPLWAQSLLHNF